MKNMKKTLSLLIALVIVLSLAACSGGGKSTDFSKVLADSTWITYHWYFNEKNGDNGFFSDDGYYTWEFTGSNEFSVSAKDGSFSGKGTMEWTSANQADVYFVLGDSQEQYWTAEFSYSSSHPEDIDFMIQETNFVYVLESIE